MRKLNCQIATVKFPVRKVIKICIVCLLPLSLQACFSLPDMNPFADEPASNQTGDANSIELSKQEKAKREVLLAGKSSRPSLQSLDLQPVRLKEVAVPKLSLEQKRAQYEALLPLIKDTVQKQQVAFRLADIKMLIAEQKQQDGDTAQRPELAYADAISDYQQVLSQHSITLPEPGITLTPEQQALNRKQMDAMYQLTRALDLSAKPEQSVQVAKNFLQTFTADAFGITPYHLELYFRIGEYYFNRQQYLQAVGYYSQVVDYGNEGSQQTSFYSISAYMLGWSHFKLDQYDNAMQGFANMLDASLVQNSKISSEDLNTKSIEELGISKGELRLVKDAVRVMALTFSYQGNAEAINKFFAVYGNRDYEQLVFDELAQQHLDNDRFQDSANVLFGFAELYPVHPKAIEFYIRHIDAFVLGDFPEKVLQAKENFVQTYSLGFGIVNDLNTPVGRAASPYLREYIQQLAQTEHSIAQGIDNILIARLQAKAQSNNEASAPSGFVAATTSQEQNNAWRLASNEDLQALSREAYIKAKGYYQNFIRTFSPSPEIAPLRFYLAEALLALDEYEAAIEAFETYAYSDMLDASTAKLSSPEPVEAAYAALLVYQKMADANTLVADKIDTRSSMPFNAPLTARQVSQAKFANAFSSDRRAATVVLTLMQGLFAQQNYIPAQEWAMWLLSKKALQETASLINTNMQESAMLVMAHSHFAMDAFAQAESSYRELLTILPADDERREVLKDRLAASLYKQAENLLIANKLDTASLQAQGITSRDQLSQLQIENLQQGLAYLQSVVQDTPLSQFRLAAQYDSAVYLSLLEQWPQAISTFIDFRQRYPQHELSKGIEDQLFYAYQQTQDWPKAAKILLAKHEQTPNTETGRLALFQAAEYFEKAGDRANALDNFRRYAHQYPSPHADANEARFILSEYYLESGEDSKRRFWLNKIVDAHRTLLASSSSEINARSVYLASMAAMVFARDADIAYTRIKLTQPLDKSLARKQQALQKAISEYDTVISFGSAEFVTAANYQLANLYSTLANDLMDSARPDGLSALELSQYEILLEEQAYPFEETAIDLHEKNIVRVQSGIYDQWIKSSFEALKNSMPGRYNKPEVIAEVSIDDF